MQPQQQRTNKNNKSHTNQNKNKKIKKAGGGTGGAGALMAAAGKVARMFMRLLLILAPLHILGAAGQTCGAWIDQQPSGEHELERGSTCAIAKQVSIESNVLTLKSAAYSSSNPNRAKLVLAFEGVMFHLNGVAKLFLHDLVLDGDKMSGYCIKATGNSHVEIGGTLIRYFYDSPHKSFTNPVDIKSDSGTSRSKLVLLDGTSIEDNIGRYGGVLIHGNSDLEVTGEVAIRLSKTTSNCCGALYAQGANNITVKGASTKFLLEGGETDTGRSMGLTMREGAKMIVSDGATFAIRNNKAAKAAAGEIYASASLKIEGSGSQLIVEGNNAAKGATGGLEIREGSELKVVEGASFILKGNTAKTHGGGMTIQDPGSRLVVTGANSQMHVENNIATSGSGGGIAVSTGATIYSMAPSLFRGNKAVKADGGGIGFVSLVERDNGASTCVQVVMKTRSSETKTVVKRAKIYTEPATVLQTEVGIFRGSYY
jgi:hypothetical protein